MGSKIRVAIIGLDTSHSVEFTRSMNDPQCPDNRRTTGLTAVSCLRFSTPFQSEDGLDQRQKLLESWGVPVTANFDEAVADCDAIMLEINAVSSLMVWNTVRWAKGLQILHHAKLQLDIDKSVRA